VYENPDFGYFEQRFGCQTPDLLVKLYELEELLAHTPVSVQLPVGSIDILQFRALTPAMIDLSENHDWIFFAFALGLDGETFLISPENDDRSIYVHFSDYEEAPERSDILFDELLDKLPDALRKNESQVKGDVRGQDERGSGYFGQ
jgi:hypothetical protein